MSVTTIRGRKRPALLDRCPRCCASVPAGPARMQLTDDQAAIRATYRCRFCAHSWLTSWNASAFTAAELAGVR